MDHHPHHPVYNISVYNHSITTDFLSMVNVTGRGDPSLAQAVVVSTVTCVIIVFNVLIIGTLSSSIHSHSMIGYFILSLAGADLLTGVLLTPLSIFPALVGSWPYGRVVCKLTAYVEVTLWAVVVYTLGWMGVDR